MSGARSAELAVADIRWIFDAIAGISDDTSLAFERTRLENLLDRANSVARSSMVSEDDLEHLDRGFLTILAGHPKLQSAQSAMLSNAIVEIVNARLAHFKSAEKTRTLTSIELHEKEDIEKALRTDQAKLRQSLEEMRE
jgi:bacterioferritin (cytochrome b1)